MNIQTHTYLRARDVIHMPHIELIIQFMVPGSLSIWMQHAGRAGCSPSLQVRAVLLVQPSVFQEQRDKRNMDELEVSKDPDKGELEGLVVYVKVVKEGLCTWIEAKTCQRDMADSTSTAV
ncbi:hypothetical protein PAXINDRAFT_85070 [Paxillus involutus ATCC 200175]|uniref:Uncharacterized protein n=1 Tax=Paxillus involutus ATCC 200175 TaxID=664439 RepID=A0A0C9TUW5_PAXIN|nr:hypothetical protein PAXINDRAFT_85070 [Paxillus involutus ATCC 200175]